MKIAICLYGQPRTWKHAAGWILDQYQGNVDYFCSVKNFNNSTTTTLENGVAVIQHEPKFVSDYEITQLLQTFNPVRKRVERFGEFVGYGPSHYLFKSMCASLLLKQQHELATGVKYDLVILQRYDLVTGPDINWFKSFKLNDFTNDKLYVGAEEEYKPHEGFHRGISDWIIAGNDAVMSMLMASLINAFNPSKYGHKTADNHLYTSHVILKRICSSLDIMVQVDQNLNSLILRESTVDLASSMVDIKKNWDLLSKR